MPPEPLLSNPLPIVLASASPRRVELLRLAGLEPLVRAAQIDEAPNADEGADVLAVHLARGKAEAVASSWPEPAIVLGADTVVVVDGDLLGKPGTRAEAEAMLRRLSGRAHGVVTGYCVRRVPDGQEFAGFVTTSVLFRSLSSAQIAAYVDTAEPFDKAGGYGIQGRGAALVRGVQGSYTNVVGLPLAEVLDAIGWLGGPQR